MKFLKKSQINFRNVKDDSIAIQIDGEVTMDTPNVLLLPKGTTAERPSTYKLGHIRYNTTTNELEVYQGALGRQAWRALRYKESAQIIQQSLGYGNEEEYIFGPLDPAPPTPDQVDDKSQWTGSNLIVLVENVVQLNNTNYVIIQNPCRVTGNIISFSATAKKIISANQSVINFVERGFWAGQVISITNSEVNDGSYTVTNVTPTEITVSETLLDELVGENLTIIGFSSTLPGPVHGIANPGDPYPEGYYLKFDSPVPEGSIDPKYVTVLHGFDR